MATSLIFQVLDEEGDQILDRFEERTGLESQPIDGDARQYPLEGDDHQVEVVGTLTDIDEDWSEHLALQDPS